MVRFYYIRHIVFIVLFLFTVACAGRRPTGPPAGYQPSILRPISFPKLKEPVIRIGLKTDAKTVLVSGKTNTYFREGVHGGGVASPILLKMSFVPQVTERYSVQISSFAQKENAEHAVEQLRQKTKYPVFIFHNPDKNLYQVRLGPFQGKEKAQQAIEEAKTIGYPDAFYVSEDAVSANRLPQLQLLDEGGNLLHVARGPVDLWSGEETTSVDNNFYRGYISAFVNNTGRITVVNTIYMEDYLKGVVPAEMGPAVQSNYEALKAQAVAARTYAYRNLGQFEAEGFDLCATPRCQVYSGISAEHGMTSRAVEETADEILTYQGEPIHALYTSTCGGRTENAEFMFEGWNYPYLKSVACYPEELEIRPSSVKLTGISRSWAESWVELKTGIRLNSDSKKPLTREEAEEAIHLLLTYLHKTPCSNEPLTGTSWIELGNYLVSQLCWEQKQQALLSREDYRYFVEHLAFAVDPGPKSEAFLFLFHDQILVPSMLDRFNLYSSVSRKELTEAIFRLLEHYHQINTDHGLIRYIKETELQVVNDLGVHSYLFGPVISLYQKMGQEMIPRSEMVCGVGDEVEYMLRDNRIELLVCELKWAGASMDGKSKYTFWRESFTPAELGEKVSRYLDVGEVVDLIPLSYGQSGRIYEMKIIGTRNSGILKGIRVRWALGLRDNFFVIDRIFDEKGRVKSFVFSGRGWGHGVGLCQTGALGYARLGKDYKAILQHYYSGVQLEKIKHQKVYSR